MSMEEAWRDIPEWEGYYMGSTLGRVKSVPKSGKGVGKGGYRKEKIRKTYKSNCGYLTICLCKNSGHKYQSVARLIAFTFPEICGEYFPGAEVDHLDGNPENNRADNLRWKTHSGNLQNPITKYRRSRSLTNKTGTPKPVEQFSKSGEHLVSYPTAAQAERDTGICAVSISQCCKGKRKTAGGYTWQFIS